MSGQVQSVGIPSVFGQYGTQVVYKLANVLLGPATVINFNSGANATLENGVLTIDISGNSSINVVDNLLSTSETDTLSANQGRVLSETIANLTASDVGADDSGAAATAEQNAKNYAEGLVTGLWDDRGTHDASLGNYPSSGGSGVAGAILKGDIWTISVAGTLGANTVEVGDTVRALVDSPDGDSTWAIGQNNIGWVPENAANKATDLTSPNNTDYPTTQAVATALADYQEALPVTTGATKFLREDLTWQDAPIPVLTELNFNVQKSGSPAVKIYWDLTALTAQYIHVMPNKPINFGDLPSVAATNGNSLSGTRNTITGGQFNTVTGTANSVQNSNSNTVSGTSNTIIGGASNTVGGVATCTANILNNCTSLLLGTTLGNTITSCTFNDISNAYTTPESPLAFNAPQDNVIFTGWVNDGMNAITWPKGYTVKGQKRRITGVFGVSGSSYYSQLDTVVELAATSTGSVGTLSPHKDLTKRPVAANSGFFADGYAEHTLTFHGYDPTANQHITGQRVIRERQGVVTVATPTGVPDTIENGFLLSLTVSVAPQAGYQGLIIQVRNTANSNTCQWQATLVSKLVQVSLIP